MCHLCGPLFSERIVNMFYSLAQNNDFGTHSIFWELTSASNSNADDDEVFTNLTKLTRTTNSTKFNIENNAINSRRLNAKVFSSFSGVNLRGTVHSICLSAHF